MGSTESIVWPPAIGMPALAQIDSPPARILRIVSIGKNPWLVKELQGTVRFKRPDAARLKVTALDGNGDALKPLGSASEIRLQPNTLYYLISH